MNSTLGSVVPLAMFIYVMICLWLSALQIPYENYLKYKYHLLLVVLSDAKIGRHMGGNLARWAWARRHLPCYLFPFLLSLSPDLCKDIPRAPFLTHQNSIKFILQNIFCSQEVISNWLSVQASAATVEYQEDPSIIGRPACSWPDPTLSFTLESRFRPDKRFRAAAPCGDPSQDTIYYPPLPPPWHPLKFHRTIWGCWQTITNKLG